VVDLPVAKSNMVNHIKTVKSKIIRIIYVADKHNPYHVDLIIWGLQDKYFSDAVLDGAARYISQSMRLVTVPGAGHWVHRDASEVVNREIRSWLRTLENSK
jgi:pimeloyl-ACP methyl ester carboxylesterase